VALASRCCLPRSSGQRTSSLRQGPTPASFTEHVEEVRRRVISRSEIKNFFSWAFIVVKVSAAKIEDAIRGSR
jgi:hypothetical protein